MQLVELQERYEEFLAAGAEIVAISNECRELTAKMKQELGITYPMLSDTSRTVITDYGVFHDKEAKGRPIARPAAFVIDGNGIIGYRYVGESQLDRPLADDLLQAASSAV